MLRQNQIPGTYESRELDNNFSLIYYNTLMQVTDNIITNDIKLINDIKAYKPIFYNGTEYSCQEEYIDLTGATTIRYISKDRTKAIVLTFKTNRG